MTKRDFILIFLGLALLGGFWIWLAPSPPKIVRAVTLSIETNSSSLSTNELVFRLQNDEPRTIFLSRMFVETKTPNGWLVLNEITPADSRVVDAGKAKDLPINFPSGSEPWRLRVAYGDQVGGPRLFLAKIAFAIDVHKFPGAGFGVFAGSNSLSSAEIAR